MGYERCFRYGVVRWCVVTIPVKSNCRVDRALPFHDSNFMPRMWSMLSMMYAFTFLKDRSSIFLMPFSSGAGEGRKGGFGNVD